VRFGVIWRSDDRSAWYASYGNSFNTSGELCNCDAPGAKSPPEKSRSVEVGAKLDLFEGRLSARGALFHSTKTNERNLDSPSGQPIAGYLLSGRRHASGVDIDRPGRITRRWEAFASCTWTRARGSTRRRRTARSPASRSAIGRRSRRATAARSPRRTSSRRSSAWAPG
jgi:catecholate siderophore receptor